MISDIKRIENKELQVVCVSYVRWLIRCFDDKALTEGLYSFLNSCLEQLNNISNNDSFNKKALNNFHDEIKAGRNIDKEPIHALISSPILNDDYFYSKALNQLIALVLIISTDSTMIKMRVDSALRQLRLMVYGLNKGDEKEIRVIKSIPENIGEDGDWLDSLHKLMQASDKVMRNRLTPIHRILEDFIKRGPKNVKVNRKAKLKEGESNESVIRHNIQSSSDIKFGKVHRFNRVISSKTIDDNEHRADQPSFGQYIEIELIAPESIKQSLALQNQRVRQIANQLVRQEKRLVSSWNQLTPHELKVLVRSIDFDKNDLNPILNIVYLSLITGINVTDLIESCGKQKNNRKIKKAQGQYILERSLSLPIHKQTHEALSKLVRLSDSIIEIPLPESVASVISNLKCNDFDVIEITEAIDKWLLDLNKRNKTRITLGRIKSHLKDWLIMKSIDTPIIECLTGDDVIDHSGIYYYQLDKSAVLKIYNEYLTTVLPKIASKDEFNSKNRTPLVGSQLFIKTSAVKQLFNHYQIHLESKIAQHFDLEAIHNLFTAYTYLVLNISSGHRPVNDPYNTVNAFSIYTSTLHIQDKDVRGQQSGRVIILPKIAIDQYQYYMEHLTRLRLKLARTGSKLNRHVNDVLEGQQALFFWLENGAPVRLTPSNTYEQIAAVFPFKLNWHRHHMRTILGHALIPPQLIDAWMGHSTFGNETFSKYSGSSLSQMNLVADVINNYLVSNLSVYALQSTR